MSKISEFYAKALADEATKTELATILGEKTIQNADDEQLAKVGELAKKLGYDITIEEAKEYLNPEEAELDDDDLEAVAGGKGDTITNNYTYTCENGIGAVDVEV